MTCAGITSLVIAADKVQSSDARVVGDRIECCVTRNAGDADRIERGIEWLGQHYSVTRNPGSGTLAALLSLRPGAGRPADRPAVHPLAARPGQPDRADWYREGADWLVRNRTACRASGRAWACGENNPLIGTSFALLFLSKGRWPVLLAKLQHGRATIGTGTAATWAT